MIAQVRTELLKLRLTRSTWGFLAAALVIAALRMVMVLASVGTAAGIAHGSATATLTLAGGAASSALVVLLLAVVAATGELRHSTLTDSVLQGSNRRRLALAKCVALGVVGAVSSLVLAGAGMAVALGTGVGGGVGLTALASMVLAAGVGGAFWGWIGVGVGLLVDVQPVAVVVPIAWLVVIEPLVGSFGLLGLVPWLPGALPAELATAASGGPSPLAALLMILVYAGLVSVVGTRRLVRRDIA